MRYKAKPCEIEAVQWTGHNLEEIMQFTLDKDNVHIKDGELVVSTLEGDLKASVGDYIIKGLRGEYYPCKPDVFCKKYEPCGIKEGIRINDKELKKCPFCGSKDIQILDNSTPDDEYYMIECQNCNAAVCFGYDSTTKEGAIRMWNRRANKFVINQSGSNCTNISNAGTVNIDMR